jgi:tRNA(Glu) U13 pseudouridine synthase TruD
VTRDALDEPHVGERPAPASAEPLDHLRLSFQLPAGTYATVLLAALGVSIEGAQGRARRMDLLATPGLS